MSEKPIEDVFELAEEEEEEDKGPTKATKEMVPSGQPESPEADEGARAHGKEAPSPEEAPAPAAEEDISWFGEPEEEEPPTTEEESPKPDEEPTEEPTEEPAEEPTETEEEWFEPAPEEEKPTEEAPVEVSEEWFEEAEAEEPEVPEEGVVKGAIIEVEPSPIVAPAVSAADMKRQMKLFQSLKASLLDSKKDISNIQGNPYIKRSGWRKLALAFNISDEIIKETKEVRGEDFEWRIWVRTRAPNGRSVVGIGACSSDERNFAHLRHDVYAIAHTRAKNRALSDLIGSGEVSWEELTRSW